MQARDRQSGDFCGIFSIIVDEISEISKIQTAGTRAPCQEKV